MATPWMRKEHSNSEAVGNPCCRLKATLREIEAFELSLERLEKWRGMPPCRATPIADRMANLGIRKSLIEYVDAMLASISRLPEDRSRASALRAENDRLRYGGLSR